MDEDQIVQPGGWCAPSETYYRIEYIVNPHWKTLPDGSRQVCDCDLRADHRVEED
jgi:hypothetical protein